MSYSLGFNSGIDPNVNCGGHYANFCHECPSGNGASWCNGDCEWNFSINECQLKGVYATKQFLSHNQSVTRYMILIF